MGSKKGKKGKKSKKSKKGKKSKKSKKPKKATVLKSFGWTPKHKLARCHGDCDSDKHCAKGLKCFQRNGFKKVPGCAGKGVKDMDYCIRVAKKKSKKTKKSKKSKKGKKGKKSKKSKKGKKSKKSKKSKK